MDTILINRLEVFAYHGVNEEEKTLGQKFIVSGKFYVDFSKAYDTDNIDYALNYSELVKLIESFIRSNRYSLLETLSQRLAEVIFDKYSQLYKLVLKIEKPWAPIKFPLESVAVEIERSRHKLYLCVYSSLEKYKEEINVFLQEIHENRFLNIIKVSDVFVSEMDNTACISIEIDTILEIEQLIKLLDCFKDNVSIAFYDRAVYDKTIQIPQPELLYKEYLLGSIVKIAPYFVHPIFRKTIQQLYVEFFKNKRNRLPSS